MGILKNTKHEIERPRDDLRTAFSGDQNRGPAANPKTKKSGSHLSSRRLTKDSGKTPIR